MPNMRNAVRTARNLYIILQTIAAMLLGVMTGMPQRALAADDPFISIQPTNQYRDVGQSGYFRVVAGGTEPLYYQWIKDGLALANGTQSRLGSSLNIQQIGD